MSNSSIPEDWDQPASDADRRWWLEKAPSLEWMKAKSGPPHWYVVLGRTKGMSRADFERVGRVIRTFGEGGAFWGRSNLYLFTAERDKKMWVMFGAPPKPSEVTLINLADASEVYGPQEFDQEWIDQLRPVR